MNGIRKINEINQKELEQNVSERASWHFDYRDTSYVFIGGLPQLLAENDIITIFSQWGIPTHINLVKDRETGESKGFCYLKYQNYKSCILAIDNFNGIKIHDRTIKVDHVYFKLRDGVVEDDYKIEYPSLESLQIEQKEKIEPKRTKLLHYKETVEENTDNIATQVGPEHDPDTIKDSELGHKGEPEVSGGLVAVDDEFKDPMEAFIKEKKHSSHRHRLDRRHRHHEHKERSDDRKRHRSSHDRSSRDKSPQR